MGLVNKRQIYLWPILLLTTSFLFAAVLISSNYKGIISLLAIGGGKVSSNNYNISEAVLGQGMFGRAESPSYRNESGFTTQAETLANPPAADLKEAFVYPNPYKPNSRGSRFYADRITFKKLPVECAIKIFTISGELAATLEKTNSAVDYYEWSATNDSGEKLASGVYVYFITTPKGEKAKGKFSIVK